MQSLCQDSMLAERCNEGLSGDGGVQSGLVVLCIGCDTFGVNATSCQLMVALLLVEILMTG